MSAVIVDNDGHTNTTVRGMEAWCGCGVVCGMTMWYDSGNLSAPREELNYEGVKGEAQPERMPAEAVARLRRTCPVGHCSPWHIRVPFLF